MLRGKEVQTIGFSELSSTGQILGDEEKGQDNTKKNYKLDRHF